MIVNPPNDREALLAQTYSATIARAVVRTASTSFREWFLLLRHRDLPEHVLMGLPKGEAVITDWRPFEEQPKVRPGTLYRRDFQTNLDESELRERFMRRAGRQQTAARPVSEDRLWALVGQPSVADPSATVSQLVERLVSLNEQEQAAVALTLDHLLTRLAEAVVGAHPRTYSADQLAYWSACVLARGREAYERAVLNPPVFEESENDFDGEPLVSWMAEVQAEAMRASPPELKASYGAELRDLYQSRMLDFARFDGVANPLGDAFYNASVAGNWFSAWVLSASDGGYTERLITFSMPILDAPSWPSVEILTAVDDQCGRAGERVLEVDGPHAASSPMSHRTILLDLRRRFTGTLDEYLNTFVDWS